MLLGALWAGNTSAQQSTETTIPGPGDAVYLHYDIASDPDDLHAILAGSQLSQRVGLLPNVIIGTHGYRQGNVFLTEEAQIQGDTVYGRGNYRNVNNNFLAFAPGVAAEWDAIVANGGRVYVAEGGTSDFTFEVLSRMREDMSRVTVVQHSHSGRFNETAARPSSLAFVQANSTYVTIDNGNQVNGTADFRVTFNNTNRDIMLASSPLWAVAFDLWDGMVDFSDTVELLHIYNIGRDQVSNIQEFAEFVGPTTAELTPVANPSVIASTPIPPPVGNNVVINVELADGQVDSVGTDTKDWVRRTELGRTGWQFLPDTRVTSRDRLIRGVNFWDFPDDDTPYIEYEFEVEQAGEYLAEVAALHRGTEDNGAHMWLNGQWVLERIQWCQPNRWVYSSALRLNSNSCGVQGSAIVQLQAGTNVMRMGAREDGVFLTEVRFTGRGISTSNTPVFNPTSQPVASGGQCVVEGDTFRLAASAYAAQCSLPRVDCDPVVGVWLCASFDDPQLSDLTQAVVVSPTPEPEPVVVPEPAPETVTSDGGACQVTANNLRDARNAFALQCPLATTRDCDPIGDQWICSSEQIGSGSPRITIRP